MKFHRESPFKMPPRHFWSLILLLTLMNYFKISKVTGCELQRIGDLEFEFQEGACGTFSAPEERIFLCFSKGYENQCRR